MNNRDMVVLIILNYNDSDATIRLVEAIRDYSSISKIVVVDNMSTDGSFETLKKLRLERVDVIQTSSNGGFASGNNFGIRYAIEKYDAAYVIISNPDVEFEETAVNAMQKALEADTTVGITAPKMLNASGKAVKTAWKRPGFWACVSECFIVSNSIYNKLFGGEKSIESISKERALVLQGSLFMISVAAYESIGGMDEGTFLYYEENILAHRLFQHGFRERLITDFSYIHRRSESIDKSIRSERTKFNIQQQSREYYCVKYLETGSAGILLLRTAFHIGLLNFMFCRGAQKKIKAITGKNANR